MRTIGLKFETQPKKDEKPKTQPKKDENNGKV